METSAFRPTQTMRAVLIGSLTAIAIALSWNAGTPAAEDLPIVALGWPLLLHLERGAAVVAVLAVVAVVGWRASKGEMPTRFANIEYRVDGATDSIDEIRTRLAWLEFEAMMRDEPPLEGEGGEA